MLCRPKSKRRAAGSLFWLAHLWIGMRLKLASATTPAAAQHIAAAFMQTFPNSADYTTKQT